MSKELNTIVIGVIVLAVVLGIGFAGYFMGQQKEESSVQTAQSTGEEEKTECPEPEPVECPDVVCPTCPTTINIPSDRTVTKDIKLDIPCPPCDCD